VRVDPQRIGAMGLSLGGMTVTLLAFDPDLGDARVRAAVSIAGPLAPFERAFFAGRPVDFLMIAGSADVIVPPGANAWPVLARVPDADLVMIAAASHAGFDDATTPPLPGMGNPDRFGCWILAHDLELERAVASPAFRHFVRAEKGMVMPAELPRPCAQPAPVHVLDPRRQQAITMLAVRAFFDATLAPDGHARHAGARYLHQSLAEDFPEVQVLRAPPRG
jgi:predicted dienelactone hydrolase